MEGFTFDDLSESNSPLILIPLFFSIKRVLKKLITIKPPIAPTRDTGNGNNNAAMNPIAMYILIHFRVCNRKCLLLLEISFTVSYPFFILVYTTQKALLNQMCTVQYKIHNSFLAGRSSTMLA